MSQAKRIYEYISRSKNHAADAALRLAVARAEEPYRSVIMEAVLDRGDSGAVSELVEGFHELSEAKQRLVLERAGSLYGGLRRAAGSMDNLTRLNVLSIISRSGELRLAGLVGQMLRGRHYEVSRQGGNVFLEMARQVLEKKKQYENRQLAVSGGGDVRSVGNAVDSDVRYLEEALAEAVGNYDRHRRHEVILAAMYLVPADREDFWGGILRSPGEVERVVRQLMVQVEDSELADFCLSALKYPLLRVTAVRAIGTHCRREYVVALACGFSRRSDEQINDALKLVEKPAWLTCESLPMHRCQETEQLALVDFVSALGVTRGQLGGYFCGCVEKVSEAVAEKIMAELVREPGPEIVGALRRMLSVRYEKVARIALDWLIKLRPEGLSKIVAGQLRSPHRCLREAAENYYQKFAFNLYWNNFENLSAQHRVAGAQAVFKIDPSADQRWRSYAMSDRPTERLRAIHVSRISHLANRHEDVLCRLAGDKDCMVRSYAVAVLGELGDELSEAGKAALRSGLKDVDGRVRANAVEALGHCSEDDTSAVLKPFAYSNNNRVRANAVDALLKWKVDMAGQAVRDMCKDSRPRHRVSGRWVLEKNQEIIRQLRAGSEQKGTNVSVAV